MKDPAALWYFNDWAGGTMAMTRHQKGAYLDLLTAQFNLGDLSLDQIKTVLGADFGPSWPALQKKFKHDVVAELYYNERLKQEMEKRKSYTASRRSNAQKHMPKHMEDRNENRNETKNNTELPSWLNLKAWTAWEQHRKEKGQKLTPTSVRLQLKKLEKYKEKHADMIRTSIENGWTGLFPLKEDGFRKPNKYVEPNYDKETNERRNLLVEQMKANK